jgi:hypothetical protein
MFWDRPVDRRVLWYAGGATAAAALFFPKIEGIRNHGRPLWQLLIFFVPLDVEGLILIPVIVLVTLTLFRWVGGWALEDTDGRNRPARAGLVVGILGLVGIVLFWISAPIILGGLAITLGLAGLQLAPTRGRSGIALAALILGACATLVGVIMWAFIT